MSRGERLRRYMRNGDISIRWLLFDSAQRFRPVVRGAFGVYVDERLERRLCTEFWVKL